MTRLHLSLQNGCRRYRSDLIRMAFDFTVIVIAFLFGGKIGIVTILMGFTLGPVIGAVGEKIGRFIECD